MHHLHQHGHGHAHLHARSQRHVASVMMQSRTLADQASRVLVARSTSTCTNDSDPGCTKPTQVPTLAISLAAVVPIVGLLIVLVILHRRNQRKLRAEDAKDKYKSLDFGMEPTMGGGKKNKRGPEMTISEKELKGGHGRGISLEHGSPYILPVGLHGSRESFHSLSRSQTDPHDPYRPVTFGQDGQSIRSPSRAYKNDNASMYTTSSGGTEKHRMNGMHDGLLKNAQGMSTSHPIRTGSMSPETPKSPEIKYPEPAVALSPLNPRHNTDALPPPPPPPVAALPPRGDSTSPPVRPNPIPTISVPEPAAMAEPEFPKPPSPPNNSPFPPRVQSQTAVVQESGSHMSIISTSSYGDGVQVTPPSPRESEAPQGPISPEPLRPQFHQNNLGADDYNQYPNNNNRLSIFRPLPPDEHDSEENPEQRANRIRSFYKEYFDDSKPEPVGGHSYTNYYEDYGSEYQDGAIYDPRARGFVVAQPNAPFAEPVTRRAMTPPPRAPPRFRSNTGTGPRPPHMSNGSMASGRFMPPRGNSSMSGRLPGPNQGPRKPMPPPAALSSLPTPAKLKDDAMVFNPIDFAPPVSYRERQNGRRPDSPLGTPRPFSPAVRPHTPLASSYDDLAVMPSPHLLRKSGTFTALDFAPPPRFRDPMGGNASDAGSIRSNRSGMSARGQMAVRGGANRVSRIPKDVVGTREGLMEQLRPRMDLVSKA